MGYAGQGRRRAPSVSGNRRRVRNASLRWKGLGRSRAGTAIHGSPCREGDPQHAKASERCGCLRRKAHTTERRRETEVTSPAASLQTFDPRRLRNVLGSFTTGVVIVTSVGDEGRPIGLTVNSFNSVSMQPPLILWSLAL